MFQTSHISQVVAEECGIRSPIKAHAEALKPFLSGRVPYLQDQGVATTKDIGHNDGFGDKIGTNGRLVLTRKFPRVVAVQETRLANAVDEKIVVRKCCQRDDVGSIVGAPRNSLSFFPLTLNLLILRF